MMQEEQEVSVKLSTINMLLEKFKSDVKAGINVDDEINQFNKELAKMDGQFSIKVDPLQLADEEKKYLEDEESLNFSILHDGERPKIHVPHTSDITQPPYLRIPKEFVPNAKWDLEIPIKAVDSMLVK